MFGHLKALNQVEASPEIDPRPEIRSTEFCCIDHQVASIDLGAVYAQHGCAGFPPNAQPSALAAPDIGDAVDRQLCRQ